MIYLDNAATTYPKSERVYEKMNQIMRELAVNAGRGGYQKAVRAAEIISDTRLLIKELFHANDLYETIFTPSATFAMNQILFGQAWESGDVIYVSCYEHNSVMRTVEALKTRFGVEWKVIPTLEDHTIDVEQFDYLCAKDQPQCVIASAVSNVTGYCLPIGEITKCAKEQGAIVIIDAAQAAGLVNLDVRQLDADYIVWAGHKTLYGPLGVGGYVAKKSILEELENYQYGGTGSDSLNLSMPLDTTERLEAGSHNIIAIAGLKEALLELKDMTGSFDESVNQVFTAEQELGHYAYEELRKLPQVVLYPSLEAEQLSDYVGIVSFALEGYDAEEIGEILDEDYGIAVRTGYHCAPLVHDEIGSKDTLGTVRVSVGKFSTRDDVDKLVEAIGELS